MSVPVLISKISAFHGRNMLLSKDRQYHQFYYLRVGNTSLIELASLLDFALYER